jgi:hypothetical protein
MVQDITFPTMAQAQMTSEFLKNVSKDVPA